MIFENFEEKATFYLDSNFVKIVNNNTGKETICFTYAGLGRKKLGIIYQDDTKEDMSLQFLRNHSFFSPDVGYINTQNGPLYIQRNPSRTYRVGLSPANSNIPDDINRNDLIKMLSEPMLDFHECLENDGAFHKSYCIRNRNLFYQDENLGPIINNIVCVETESEAIFHKDVVKEIYFRVKEKQPEIDYDSDI